jgi:hypothetical protein
MKPACPISRDRLPTEAIDIFAAFICMIHHPEAFEVCEVNGELFVRPRTYPGRSKAKWPTNVNLEARTTTI